MVELQSSPEFWNSLTFIVFGAPERYESAWEPVCPALGLLALGHKQANPAQLLVAGRRVAHAMEAHEWFRDAPDNPSGISQWEAEQRFGWAMLALRASADNCGHFLNELLALNVRPERIDVARQDFRAKVAQADPELARDLESFANEAPGITAYRHAVAHRAFPRVLLNSVTNQLSVPEDPGVIDPVEQWRDGATREMRLGVPAVDVLADGLSVARGLLAATNRAVVRQFRRDGFKAPRQPSHAEFGRAFVRLALTGDYNRPDTGPIINAYAEQASKLYPSEESDSNG